MAKRFEISKKAASLFVSGENLEDAIRAAREANGLGIMATIDQLGESVENAEVARKSTDMYIEVLERIAETGVDGNISVKLTQLGLAIDYNLCLQNLERIVRKASELNIFVRVDMEDSPYTQKTLDIFSTLRKKYSKVGIVLQALLYRTEKDVEEIIENGHGVRICKGAYTEPKDIAFPRKPQVDQNFIHLLEMLLSEKARNNGVYVGIATHDHKIIDWAKEFIKNNGVGKDEFEFQMLFGIRRDLQEELVKEGYRMRAYIPFGTQWYPYYMRRLAERPRNIFSFCRTVLSD
ncbi:MAG: proline dehydrogenase family protein [Thermoplasmata archaeon]|nr:proline dehydrogenase family protein [Thermoplasmata archaeon]